MSDQVKETDRMEPEQTGKGSRSLSKPIEVAKERMRGKKASKEKVFELQNVTVKYDGNPAVNSPEVVEVLEPPELRGAVSRLSRRTARLYASAAEEVTDGRSMRTR